MSSNKIREAIKLVLSCRQKQLTGRVTLMKHLYFLQEVSGVELGLKFQLYTWGPFDKKVLVAKDWLIKQDEIVEKPCGEDKGFEISLNKEFSASNVMTSKYSEISKHIAKSEPKTLEALSTLHKVQQMLPAASMDKVIHTVKTLKPHLSMNNLRTNYRNLQEWKWLPQPQA